MTVDQLPPLRSMPARDQIKLRQQLEKVVERKNVGLIRVSRRTALGIGVGLLVAGSAAASVLLPTEGGIPYVGNSSIVWKNVPDYIEVLGPTGSVAGYAPRNDVVLPPSDNGRSVPNGFGSVPVPVYGKNLKTLVGHMYPNIGFLPLGTSPSYAHCEPEKIYQDGVQTTIPCPTGAITLPNLVGVSTATAAGELSGLGVYANVIDVKSQSAPIGTILAMSPAPGTAVPARSIVTIENVSAP